jgi:hypothetical protein
VFLVGLAVPLGGFLLRTAQPLKSEKRGLSPPPPLVLARWACEVFPAMFEAYFNDRVGFRKEMIAARQRVQLGAFGDSPSELVTVGRDGWLFVRPPAGEPPADAWADALIARRDRLVARGVRYVVFVAREKSAVYPEHLPDAVHRHPPADPVPRLMERLRAAGVAAVDALPAMERAKAAGGSLYFRTDTHWTDAGAFAGYAALGAELEWLLPGYRAKGATAFRPREWTLPDGDLAGLIGRHAPEPYTLFEEPGNPAAERPAGDLDRPHPGRLPYLPPRRTETPGRPGRVLLVHDSFGVAVRLMLASDVGRLACVGSYGLPDEVVESERPDVVVQLLVDRAFRASPP